MTRRSLAAVSLLITLAGTLAASGEEKKKAPAPAPAAVQIADTRQEIVLTPAERAHVMKGMREYLESLQGIVESLSINKLDGVAESAQRAGAKMLQDAPGTVPLKAPLAFTAMSLNTHEKFDILAERATKSASRGEVLTALAEIMGNCTSCHATFRVVSGQ